VDSQKREGTMGALAVMEWPGQSGRRYKYWVYKIGTKFKETPANYMFARETAPLTFAPVYVGQTSDLSVGLDDNQRTPCIREFGATHVHAHANSRGEAARLEEEADLMGMWDPICNKWQSRRKDSEAASPAEVMVPTA